MKKMLTDKQYYWLLGTCMTVTILAIIFFWNTFITVALEPNGFQFPLKVSGELLRQPEITTENGSAHIQWATRENYNMSGVEFKVKETNRMGERPATSHYDEGMGGYIYEMTLDFPQSETGYTYLIQTNNSDSNGTLETIISRPYQIIVPAGE
jgi:hypothetical protein